MDILLLTIAETAWLQQTGVVLLAIVVVLACFAAWLVNFVALPGNWIAVLIVAVYAWLGPDGRVGIGVGVVIAVFLIALAGEAIEFVPVRSGRSVPGRVADQRSMR